MKKTFSLLLFGLLICSGIAKAQWTDMEWSSYGIGFKTPTDFTVTQNDDKAYTANGATFTISIKPWKDASITDPMEICQKALDITPGTDKEVIEEEPFEVSGLNGYRAYCTATQSGRLVHVIIGGYLDPASETNFTVQLLFWDNEAENETNANAAVYILESFKTL